jgi:hypothetical protein
LKSFTKSISTSHILNYFSSGSKSTDTVSSSTPVSIDSNLGIPAVSDIPTAPSSPNFTADTSFHQGIFLTGLIETTAIGMNGEERPVTKSDLVRVYICSGQNDEYTDKLAEYYLLVYKVKKKREKLVNVSFIDDNIA